MSRTERVTRDGVRRALRSALQRVAIVADRRRRDSAVRPRRRQPRDRRERRADGRRAARATSRPPRFPKRVTLIAETPTKRGRWRARSRAASTHERDAESPRALASVVLALWLGGLGLLVQARVLPAAHGASSRKRGCACARARRTTPCCRGASRSASRRRRSTRRDDGITVRRLSRRRSAGRRASASRDGAHARRAHARAAHDSSSRSHVDARRSRRSMRRARCSATRCSCSTLRRRRRPATDTQRIKLTGPILLPTLVPLAVALGERPKVGQDVHAARVRSGRR